MKLLLVLIGCLWCAGCMTQFEHRDFPDAELVDAFKVDAAIGDVDGFVPSHDGAVRPDPDDGVLPLDATNEPTPDAAPVADATIQPDAAPVPVDNDEDGYASDRDCDDENAEVHPDAIETCNGRDDDCDRAVDENVKKAFYPDADGDEHGDMNGAPLLACEAPADTVESHDDCDDDESLVHPGLPEVCGDGLDNDCNGVDPDCVPNDADGDGSPDLEDCDDENAAIYPGATELCNGLDDNCEGGADEGLLSPFYPDVDRDGHGNMNAEPVLACEMPVNHSESHDDCDDRNLDVRPGRGEICGNGLDDDCNDGDVVCPPIDNDRDGVAVPADCNDNNPAIFPNAAEACNGLDDDCDGVNDNGVQRPFYIDFDEDDHGDVRALAVMACDAPEGTVESHDDCDDQEPRVHPGLGEICGNGLDDDCNRGDALCVMNDADGDGSPDSTDCDDENPTVHPGADEICDGLDNNCDGKEDENVQKAFYLDADRDGRGDANALAVLACEAPDNHVEFNDDCDDNNPRVRPGLPEICGNGLDDDCNVGDVPCAPVDNDEDGWVAPDDCNDRNAAIYPGARESCNGLDDNCEGGVDEGVQHLYYPDLDQDGHGDVRAQAVVACEAPVGMLELNDDCDDAHATAYPGADEICNDGLDNDCNGTADFVDPACQDLPDTIITIETAGPRPAMRLEVESYTSAETFGDAWQESAQVVNEAIVSLVLPAQQYPMNAFCGIRLNVTFWNDPMDVDAGGNVVGDPNQKLCEIRGGIPTVDMAVRRVMIRLGEDFYDAGNLIGVVVPGEPGCSALLVLDEAGDCNLNLP